MSDYPQPWRDALREAGASVDTPVVDIGLQCGHHLLVLEEIPAMATPAAEVPELWRFLGCPEPGCESKVLMRIRRAA